MIIPTARCGADAMHRTVRSRVLTAVALTALVASCGRGEFDPDTMTPPIRTLNAESVSAFDTGDPEALAGWSDAVFVGTVNAYLSVNGAVDGPAEGIPETQFQVSVVDTLKGDLPEVVVVNQFGGARSNGDVVVVDDVPLIEVGKTYLFSARIYAERGWFTLATEVGAVEIPDAGAAQRGAEVPGPDASEPAVVQRMREAIANELPSGDEATRPTIPDPASLPTDTLNVPPVTGVPTTTAVPPTDQSGVVTSPPSTTPTG